jgi:hypothetical protein
MTAGEHPADGRQRQRLADAAYAVADEFRDGRLDALRARQWPGTWAALRAELARRCPGFGNDDYDAALERGFVESR